jgi:hypothetical protein
MKEREGDGGSQDQGVKSVVVEGRCKAGAHSKRRGPLKLCWPQSATTAIPGTPAYDLAGGGARPLGSKSWCRRWRWRKQVCDPVECLKRRKRTGGTRERMRSSHRQNEAARDWEAGEEGRGGRQGST